MRSTALFAAASLAIASPLLADVLYDNGPFITNPTGGTGNIAGLPISNPDPNVIPGIGTAYVTGIAATVSMATAVAEDFTVPAGQEWDLDSVTLYAFQSSQTTPTVQNIQINLWTAPPFSAGSPAPVPDPLPQPLLVSPLVIPAGTGTFVCHRESSATGTSTVRPVFAYTISLAGLPNGGRLKPGTYWLQWSFDVPNTATVLNPLVTPRTLRSGWNSRALNALDGQPTSPRVWFEGREGFFPGHSDGRPYELPFTLSGTSKPFAPCGSADFDGDLSVGTDADIEAFFSCIAGDCCATCDLHGADFNGDGDLGTDLDIEAFFRVLAGGAC
jgi:hypothetical protein